MGKTAALSLAPANLITPDGEGEPAGVKSSDGKKLDPNWGRPEEEARRNAISTYALRDHLTTTTTATTTGQAQAQEKEYPVERMGTCYFLESLRYSYRFPFRVRNSELTTCTFLPATASCP